MKRQQVKVGGVYQANLQGQVLRVRIESTHSSGGWTAVNLANERAVRIKSPAVLREVETGAEDAAPGNVDVAAPESAVVAGAAGDSEVVPPEVPEPAEIVEPAEANEDKTTPSTANVPSVRKLSAIEAAARVLAAAGTPMNAKQMIEAMAAQGLWTSPGGKTPAATLFSAILREIATKGEAARFVKAGPGTFAARAS